jgi:hypothetical protein
MNCSAPLGTASHEMSQYGAAPSRVTFIEAESRSNPGDGDDDDDDDEEEEDDDEEDVDDDDEEEEDDIG